jgi:hypothetical protein
VTDSVTSATDGDLVVGAIDTVDITEVMDTRVGIDNTGNMDIMTRSAVNDNH